MSQPALHVLENAGTSVGQVLAEARRRSGQSLDQAASITRIRRRQLEALERDDLEALPGPVYTRGYLRAYAEYLGLDAAPLLAGLAARDPAFSVPVAARAQHSLSLRRVAPAQLPALFTLSGPRVAAAGLVVLTLLFGAYAWREVESARMEFGPTATPASSTSAPPIASPPPLPSAAPTAAGAAPGAAAPRQVFIAVKATEQVWLTVTVDGRPAFGGFLKPGQEATFAGRQVRLSAGKASLLVSVAGGDYQPLGALSREYSADT